MAQTWHPPGYTFRRNALVEKEMALEESSKFNRLGGIVFERHAPVRALRGQIIVGHCLLVN